MASGRTYLARPTYRFLSNDLTVATDDSGFELDESDMYYSGRSKSPEPRKPVSGARIARRTTGKRAEAKDWAVTTPSSLPVSIPDWSKILREEYRDGTRRRDGLDNDFDEEEDEDETRLPPHEFLAQQMARTRIGSFSVHEGVGRTLKGRDLSRVRNAVWAKTGFLD